MTASLHSQAFPVAGFKPAASEPALAGPEPASPVRSRWPEPGPEQTRARFPFVVSAGLPGQGLIYLGLRRTSQKPSRCSDCPADYYSRDNGQTFTARPPAQRPRHRRL